MNDYQLLIRKALDADQDALKSLAIEACRRGDWQTHRRFFPKPWGLMEEFIWEDNSPEIRIERIHALHSISPIPSPVVSALFEMLGEEAGVVESVDHDGLGGYWENTVRVSDAAFAVLVELGDSIFLEAVRATASTDSGILHQAWSLLLNIHPESLHCLSSEILSGAIAALITRVPTGTRRGQAERALSSLRWSHRNLDLLNPEETLGWHQELLMSHPSVLQKSRAIGSLVALGSPDAAGILAAALVEGDFGSLVQRKIVEGLCRLGYVLESEDLVPLCDRLIDGGIAPSCWEMLIPHLVGYGDPARSLLPWLVNVASKRPKNLNSMPKDDLTFNILRALSTLGVTCHSSEWKELIRVYMDRDQRRQPAISGAFRDLALVAETILPQCMEGLRSGDSETIIHALLCLEPLGEHGAPAFPQVSILLSTMNAETDHRIVSGVSKCLSGMGDAARQAVPELVRLARSLDSPFWFLSALRELADHAIPFLGDLEDLKRRFDKGSCGSIPYWEKSRNRCLESVLKAIRQASRNSGD